MKDDLETLARRYGIPEGASKAQAISTIPFRIQRRAECTFAGRDVNDVMSSVMLDFDTIWKHWPGHCDWTTHDLAHSSLINEVRRFNGLGPTV